MKNTFQCYYIEYLSRPREEAGSQKYEEKKNLGNIPSKDQGAYQDSCSLATGMHFQRKKIRKLIDTLLKDW
jgi:hypothetical protein